MSKVKLKICSLMKSKRGEMLIEIIASITIFTIVFSAVTLNLITSINTINRTMEADERYTAMIRDNMDERGADDKLLNYGTTGRLNFQVIDRSGTPATQDIAVAIKLFTMNDADDKNPFGVISFKPD